MKAQCMFNGLGDGNEHVKRAKRLISKTTTSTFLLPDDYEVKMPDFTFDEGRYPATTKFSSSFWTRIWFLRNKLKGELAGILQRQRVGIIAMKFEITRTHFLSDIFAVVAVVVNTLLKMHLKLTYRLRESGANFWTTNFLPVQLVYTEPCKFC